MVVVLVIDNYCYVDIGDVVIFECVIVWDVVVNDVVEWNVGCMVVVVIFDCSWLCVVVVDEFVD